jgi:hypothetical protein
MRTFSKLAPKTPAWRDGNRPYYGPLNEFEDADELAREILFKSLRSCDFIPCYCDEDKNAKKMEMIRGFLREGLRSSVPALKERKARFWTRGLCKLEIPRRARAGNAWFPGIPPEKKQLSPKTQPASLIGNARR